jgi:hypothetical protein
MDNQPVWPGLISYDDLYHGRRRLFPVEPRDLRAAPWAKLPITKTASHDCIYAALRTFKGLAQALRFDRYDCAVQLILVAYFSTPSPLACGRASSFP